MINELLQIENYLKVAGISITAAWHNQIRENPKQGKHFILVKIGTNGKVADVVQNDHHKNLRLYFQDKNNNGLTFKKSVSKTNEKDLAKITAGINATIALADKIKGCKSKKLDAFFSLAEALSLADPVDIWAEVQNFCPQMESEDGYIALENNEDFMVPVQSQSCLKEISNCLFKIEANDDPTAGEMDALGAPLINPKNGFDVKTKYNVPIYNRNADNNCFSRYGMKAGELFPLGEESRSRLSAIVAYAMGKENEDSDARPGIWYETMFKTSKSDKNPLKFIVLSTLTPNDDTLTLDGELPLSAWKEHCSKILAQIRHQKEKPEDALPGMVFIFRRPSNGAWSIDYLRESSLEELEKTIVEWDEGITNLPSLIVPNGSFQTPTIFTLAKTLSARFATQNDGFRVTNVPTWTLKDSYEFLYGSESANRKAAQALARFHYPVLIKCLGKTDAFQPWLLNYVPAISGIILKRNNLMKEEIVNGWAFSVGRLCRECDRIHESFFTLRGGKPPPELMGQRYVRMAYDNPRMALAALAKNMQTYLTWCKERQDGLRRRNAPMDFGFSIKNYEDMWTNITAATEVGTEIPLRPTDLDKIQMGMGYSYRKPRTEQTETKGNEQ